jgi:DNA repair exonuclease SbcCD ATPase subunit
MESKINEILHGITVRRMQIRELLKHYEDRLKSLSMVPHVDSDEEIRELRILREDLIDEYGRLTVSEKQWYDILDDAKKRNAINVGYYKHGVR